MIARLESTARGPMTLLLLANCSPIWPMSAMVNCGLLLGVRLVDRLLLFDLNYKKFGLAQLSKSFEMRDKGVYRETCQRFV